VLGSRHLLAAPVFVSGAETIIPLLHTTPTAPYSRPTLSQACFAAPIAERSRSSRPVERHAMLRASFWDPVRLFVGASPMMTGRYVPYAQEPMRIAASIGLVLG
jgi:hypothetical protein